MTKTEYMNKLQEKLEQFNQGLQEEILEDYEQHFAEGLAQGKSEEKIIEELGNIEDMIQEFTEEDYKQEIIPGGAEHEISPEQAYSGIYRSVVADGMVADMTIRESEDGKLYVHYNNEGETMQQLYRFYQYEEDGVFYVGVKRRMESEMPGSKRMVLFGRTIFSFNNARVRGNISLTLEVPKGIRTVQARTLSGDMEVSGLHVDELQLSTISGDLQLRGAEAEKLAIQTASGDVELGETIAGSSVIRTASGDVDVRALKSEAVTVGTGSGDVELQAEAEQYTVKTGSGDVVLKASENAKNIAVGTGSGDAELYLSALQGAQVHASVVSGEIEISGSSVHHCGGREESYTYGDAACKVKVSASSGDVTVWCR